EHDVDGIHWLHPESQPPAIRTLVVDVAFTSLAVVEKTRVSDAVCDGAKSSAVRDREIQPAIRGPVDAATLRRRALDLRIGLRCRETGLVGENAHRASERAASV